MKTLRFMIIALLSATTTWAQSNVGNDTELRNAMADGANIKVTADIDLSNSTLSIPEGTTVTIDLGGFTLDRRLTQRGDGGGQVITVREGATLNLSNVTISNSVTEVESADGTLAFAGAFSPLIIGLENKSLLFLGGNNTLYYPQPADAEHPITIGSCRAHFRLSEELRMKSEESLVKAFVLNFGEDDATSIHNSQFIIHNEAGAWYTLDGRKLSGKPCKGGIYIHNGRKEVLK